MRLLRAFLIIAVLAVVQPLGWAATEAAHGVSEAVGTASQEAAAGELGAEHAAAAHGEQHGLPPAAPVFSIGPLQFTSSMVITWCVALILIIIAQLATRNVQLIPSGLQNFMEWLVEGLYDFFGEILGPTLVKKSFWFFCSIFLFILFTNWFGLIPGVGTIGWGTPDEHGVVHHISQPILRGGNADLNMTLAMSLVFFVLWTVWSFQALGPGGFIKHIFSGGDNGKGFMAIFISLVFIIVGLIEVVSIAFRPVSLTFRLYGNIFAGENILEAMMTLVPWLGWILPLPFYFLELLVGLVQALVFALLCAVFTALMAGGHDDHGHEEKHEYTH